ncbi:MAG: YdiU family protein [Pseudomonadota bacterium]
MAVSIPFDNTYAALPEGFYTRLDPTPVKEPALIAYNDDLADLVGIAINDREDQARIFAGNIVPAGASPLAQLYSGHQFGQYNPQLGDGRAILLGEVVGADGVRRDIQLKGSGPTPYSRMGDGRAWLGPVLREYVVSEAMYHLGIPTTRALAAVLTGEEIFREGPLPGAVLTRVAQSHLRVGTFQIFAHRGEVDALRALTDYAIARHYPDADGPMSLLAAVCARQATLIPAWMSVGFIHGVMNTDNCSIAGETIDYGPCAFMDAYHEGRVFSSIDQMGRYAFGNQPRIAVWNMAQFATALIQQCDDKEKAVEEATAIVHGVPELLQQAWLRRFGQKLGIADATPEDQLMIEEFLALMQTDGADFTNTFRALIDGSARDHILDRDRFASWEAKWRERLGDEAEPEATMRAANPVLIPRNHRIEAMIEAAVAGDLAPFERLMTALAAPFATNEDFADLRRPPTPDEVVPATFCGT